MAQNRLHLDFSIESQMDRSQFITNYLEEPQFKTKPPTSDELETIGNYILWGKNADGLNAKQEGLVPLETRHKTWDDSNVESLDGLMESPTFNEASLSPLTGVVYKTKREVFSREEALKKCPDYLVPTFRDLFRRIDELDLTINYYDLAHNKRKNPPRPELLRKFTEEEQLSLEQKASTWNQYHYLKRRHELVELRREQYSLRDTYIHTPLPTAASPTFATVERTADFDADIEVLPLGIHGNLMTPLLFRPWEEIIPARYTEEDLKAISDLYWKKQAYKPGENQTYIDFRELEHVYEMFDQFYGLQDAAVGADFESNLPNLMKTLEFYMERADLSEVQREILDLKLKKVTNGDIASEINKKWGKTYTPNYISTIFRQRIIPKINAAAAYHEKLMGNIFFEEEFKTCVDCGRTMLRDADNFTRKGRSKDGFSNRCKCCEKQIRISKNT